MDKQPPVTGPLSEHEYTFQLLAGFFEYLDCAQKPQGGAYGIADMAAYRKEYVQLIMALQQRVKSVASFVETSRSVKRRRITTKAASMRRKSLFIADEADEDERPEHEIDQDQDLPGLINDEPESIASSEAD